MTTTKTLVLNKEQIQEKINRLAYQLYEDFSDEKNILIAGIARNGFVLAKRISLVLEKISPVSIRLIQIEMDKKNPLGKNTKLNPTPDTLHQCSVVVVDDVLDSGRTLIYALRPFLDGGAAKIRTVVLADRSHKKFPVSADFTGVSIATTLQEHISVVFDPGREAVYLD